ncbi:gfo/Idh/MocA family oxidoreductase [[Bacillus] caldolyticus]|uniref:Gfo/Idh/MocA family oxidoreductase n=1 Tax=Bacillus caldolyticus TaxID=1394 RepID=A0ABM6QRM7_BACCL|nr:Gfo/Idh/MocA family oxidoreductase [[Bacillus] caldolyticus]AUI38156.1 gfo/Idh/MocA family oxidoreductase [[Bacillus] caldolyticus]MED4877529.1 Gfo/Idh/MocA family oxidoreductase [Anoxybacillus geothermalis]WJQ05934.1 Gfo/Idh/MocA family oxidoreductase [Geobacillus stearothermophilus]
MRIGVLSTAHVHIDTFSSALNRVDGVQFVGIYDGNEERGKKKALEYRTRYFRHLKDILDQSEAVIICSENAFHEELALAALEAKKHVLCEKPLSISVASAEKMAKKADEEQLVLATAFPMRFNTPALQLKEALAKKIIGRILAFHGTNQGQSPGGWFIDRRLAGGGAVTDHTVHLVDMMRWMLNAEVRRVYAEVGSFLWPPYGIDDAAHVQLEFDNGVIADIDPSWSRPLGYPTWGGLTLRVTGTKGTIDFDGFAQTISSYNQQRANWDYWGDDEYSSMIKGFIDTIHHRPTELATAWDGVAAVKVVEAAYLSAQEEEVVELK